METIPPYVFAVFLGTTGVALLLFIKASRTPSLWPILTGWMAFTGILAWTGLFEVTHTLPPRFLVAVLPPLLALIMVTASRNGRSWLSSFDLKWLTLLQAMRLPVEMVLYWLFLHELTPELMTFQGRNLDILTGITAGIIFYLVFIKRSAGRRLLLGWNLISLGMLLFTVTNGVLSAPSPFQQFAFDQPNVGVLLFPFIWLPAVIVPIAYYAHIISINKLLQQEFTTVAAVQLKTTNQQ
jgi:hypothetical protein